MLVQIEKLFTRSIKSERSSGTKLLLLELASQQTFSGFTIFLVSILFANTLQNKINVRV